MKTIRLFMTLAVCALLTVSCKSKNDCCSEECQCEDGCTCCDNCQASCNRDNVIISVPRGEQAPSATPGQRNFGGMMPAMRPRPQGQGQGQAQRPPMNMQRPAGQRPAPQVRNRYRRLTLQEY